MNFWAVWAAYISVQVHSAVSCTSRTSLDDTTVGSRSDYAKYFEFGHTMETEEESEFVDNIEVVLGRKKVLNPFFKQLQKLNIQKAPFVKK